MNNHTALLTQIDYIKCLIEDNRLGEAFNILKNIQNDIERKCDQQAQTISQMNIIFTKEELKTKKGNFLNINDIWCKVLEKSSAEIELGICDGISVVKTIKKSKIKINDNSHA